MATQRTHYVDTDVVGGAGDGSSWANAFASLAAWEAHANGDLVSLDVWEDCRVRGSSSADGGSTLDIDGWTTDATHYISITVDSEDRHDGIWSDSKYRFAVSNAVLMYFREFFIRFDGLQFHESSQSAARYMFGTIGLDNTADIRISNSIIKGNGSASYKLTPIEAITGTIPTVTMWNDLIYNLGTNEGSYIDLNSANSVFNIYNSTIILGGTAVTCGVRQESGTINCKNVYVGGCYSGRAFYGTVGKRTCASHDSTGSTGLQNIAINTTNFTNVTSGSEDFRLPAGSALIGVGTDGPFSPADSTDIQGRTRTSTWDVGASEYIAAASGFALPIGQHYFNQMRH